jgi:multicomponent Na+:H+ antiporter subunit G
VTQVVRDLLMLTGAGFMLVAAIGAWRMPDILMRMHATTKAGGLGAAMIFLAVAVHFSEFVTAARAIAGLAFVVLTAPVAAHMIGRAAYLVGVPLWEGTRVDELRGRHPQRLRNLGEPPEDETPRSENGAQQA